MTKTGGVPAGGIRIDGMWKRFRGDRSRPVLRDEVSYLGDVLKRRPNPDRWSWVLRDLNLEFNPGEAVGLFGTNGSGKSTLLKILTRVMYPTVGSISVAGRVGALIEIKAGVHPDLTGRENIYLYGSLLGLRRQEIAKRFDAIVDFADLPDAVDRQLKFYSSGMSMRLGFAVAAFLQPDILLVDEVLAVGDASFQQRCLDRMRAVRNEGTTLVFVSHDLASVESISQRGIWLRDGVVAADGPVRESLGAYRHFIESAAEIEGSAGGAIGITASVSGYGGRAPATQETLEIVLSLKSADRARAVLFLGVSEGSAAPVFSLRREVVLESGVVTWRCVVARLPLPRGRYHLWVALTEPSGGDMTPWHPVASFEVLGSDLDEGLPGVMRPSPVHVDAVWDEVPSDGPAPSAVG